MVSSKNYQIGQGIGLKCSNIFIASCLVPNRNIEYIFILIKLNLYFKIPQSHIYNTQILQFTGQIRKFYKVETINFISDYSTSTIVQSNIIIGEHTSIFF